MPITVRDTGFNPWGELQRYQDHAFGAKGRFGATACFVGSMRDFNDGDAVQRLTLEHYPGMTERYLERIVEEAGSRWEILDVLIIHRVGSMEPGEPIVLVAVWSAHRAAAFDACRHLMEELKSRAPFWKKEKLAEDERWVDKNTRG